MKDKFEISLLESGEIMKRTSVMLINNIAKIVAAITLIISALVLFTDVSLASFGKESFTTTLAVMLIASYLMYFSMSEAGENAGEESEEYKKSFLKYSELSERIGGDKISDLRLFCQTYSKEELDYRRKNMLIRYGFSIDEYEHYRTSGTSDKKVRRLFRRIDRKKAISLTP